MKRKILLYFFLCACISAQASVFQGRVVDQSGQPIAYATVYPEIAPEWGTATNNDGYFAFEANLPAGNRVMVSFIGYEKKTISSDQLSKSDTVLITLNEQPELFAQLPEAKIRGWKAGRFSFNMHGGRCDECMGNGYKTIQMHFMPDVFVPCEVCGGQRYNRETLEVRWKGKNIADVLDMTVNQAVEFFEAQPTILRKIKTIQDVGLGYIKLGQSSTSLSGGESQRIKLATELSRPSTGKTLYILDEPTTGLHFEDIRVLIGVLRQLVDKGNTVVIIEHNTDIIRACDWIIDLGPEGGRGGGNIVAEGTIEDIRKNKKSITGRYI